MSKFDPQAIAHAIEFGGLVLAVNDDIAKYRPNAVGNAAYFSVSGVISAWLVGERERFNKKLLAAIAWLEDAEARNEQFGAAPWFHAMERERALALARWMDDGGDHRDIWRSAARVGGETWRAVVRPPPIFARHYLAGHLLDLLLAGEAKEGAETFEHFSGRLGLETPDAAAVAAYCCREFASGAPDETEMALWLSKFLRANLAEEWLGRGAYIEAASWLKLTYRDIGKMRDPEAALLKAYDLMPGIDMPERARLRRERLGLNT